MFNQLIYDGCDPPIIIRLAPGRQGLWLYDPLPLCPAGVGLERINKDKEERKLISVSILLPRSDLSRIVIECSDQTRPGNNSFASLFVWSAELGMELGINGWVVRAMFLH